MEQMTLDMVWRVGEKRLPVDVARVREVMLGGEWLTPFEVSDRSGVGLLSVTARMRDLRKPQFGGGVVERRHRAGAGRDVHEYRLVVPFGR